ncbi:hypothetical protein BDV96DRAFT_570899 [Lophiotrema nucula]|uniref:Uncharacterized protein n=1 Tax=Lophiotrema nucula TaxID=690887 RepID=A0A6A5ZE84_9PLEO|nr:hypothetical protein BDV96DRAFT_570899 [Lophiotrema nucula]
MDDSPLMTPAAFNPIILLAVKTAHGKRSSLRWFLDILSNFFTSVPSRFRVPLFFDMAGQRCKYGA